jgi:beta-glucosidase
MPLLNTGKWAGDEVVQLYLAHPNAGYRTPIRTLKGFKNITLKAGEAKMVTFYLSQKNCQKLMQMVMQFQWLVI